MTLEELERKSETEGLTVEEVMEYQKLKTRTSRLWQVWNTCQALYRRT